MPNTSSMSDPEKSLAEYKKIEKEQLMILDALESINEIDTLDAVIPAILKWMKKWSGCDAVGIRLEHGDDYPYYTTSGFPERFVELETHLCAYDENGSLIKDDDGKPMIECMCGNVIRGRFDSSKNFFTSDGCFWSNCTTRLLAETTDADRQARTRNRCNGYGYESVALIPLRSGGHTFGLMQYNDLEAGKFSAGTVAAFRRVADQVAASLAKLKAVDSLKRTEETLRRQKYFLEKAQDIGKIGTWELDIARNILVWTDENYKIFGVPKGTELTYERFLDCIHPDDLAYVDNAWKAALSGASYDIEHRINADGTVKWVREKARLEFDDHGKCIRAIGVTQDITDNKQKEKIQSVKLYLADYAVSHTSRELLQKFLDEAEALAESEIGFYHLIDDRQKTLSLQAWSTHTLKTMCTERVRQKNCPIEDAGVWGDSFRTQKALVYNDYQALAHKTGLPKWHAPVCRLLTVPIVRGKKVVAILGVGNKPTDYTDQDIEMITALADLSWDAISLKKSNETLQASESALKQAQKVAGVGNWMWDLKADQHTWSEEIYHIYGRDLNLPPAVYPEVCKYFTAESWAGLTQKVEAALSTGVSYQYDAEVIRPDGGHRWVTTRGEAVKDDVGQVIRLHGTVQDITKRKLAENELKASQERFKFLSEATVEGICIHDNGVVFDANTSFAKILGYDSADEIIGTTVMTKHLTAESLQKALKYIDSGYEGAYELVGIKRDGSRAPIEFITKNIVYKGKSARVVAARDITAHKAAEKLLTWNVDRNKILSETAASLLQSSNPQSLINDLCRKVMAFLDCQVFFNFMEDPDVGKLHLNACAGISDEKRREIEWLDHGTAVCGTVAQTGQRMICENIANSSDPVTELIKSFDIQAYCCHPLVIEDRFLGTLSFGKRFRSQFLPEEIEMIKSIASLVAVAVNRIKTEKEKISLETQLRQAQKVEAIGRLAGGIAHDLNNMLCPILNYAEMLAEDLSVGDARRDQALEIANAGTRARDMVRQLLAFSRKQVIELKPIDINQVIQNIEKLLLRTIPEDITFKKNLSGEIRPVLADIGQVEQILMNLTVNSADAMPDGGLLLIETGLSNLDEAYAVAHPDVRPGLYVMLSVSDTGAGMDEDTLEHIFEPFFSTKGERGTGLGLATVYGIVKQHNGNIWMYSEPGVGTTCKIYLPIAMEMPDEKKPVQKPKERQKGKETVLLVEDNDLVRHLGRIILERWGYKVLEASNGDDALSIMSAYDGVIDLLLTDVVMPGMDGKALYAKAVQKYQDLKVLYMSGYTDDIIAHRGVLSPGIQLLQKPFSVNGLASKVREVLDNNDSA